jgi:hypothetical protein
VNPRSVSFAQDVHELPDSRFFSAVDAGILQSYPEGMALARGLRTSSENPAAAKWSDFFKFRYSHRADPTADGPSKELWGAAEQASTDYGVSWSNMQGLHPSIAEAVFLGLGDQFRGAIHANLPGVDPRSASFAYTLAYIAWQVGVAQQAQSNLVNGDPFFGWVPLPE